MHEDLDARDFLAKLGDMLRAEHLVNAAVAFPKNDTTLLDGFISVAAQIRSGSPDPGAQAFLEGLDPALAGEGGKGLLVAVDKMIGSLHPPFEAIRGRLAELPAADPQAANLTEQLDRMREGLMAGDLPEKAAGVLKEFHAAWYDHKGMLAGAILIAALALGCFCLAALGGRGAGKPGGDGGGGRGGVHRRLDLFERY